MQVEWGRKTERWKFFFLCSVNAAAREGRSMEMKNFVFWRLCCVSLRGWSDWGETYWRYYFDTSFVPGWSLIFGNGMWLEISKLISWLVLFWILFIFQYMIFYFNINTVYFVMLVFIYKYFTLSTQHCIWISISYDWIYQCLYWKFKI